MDQILVASDLSVRSDRAIARAAALAREHQAKLTFIHVVDDAMPLDTAEMVRAAAVETLRGQLRVCCPEEEADHAIEAVIGDPVKEVIALASTINAGLLVLGLHRERHYLDLIRQTTMERLIRASTTPVLLVSTAAGQPYQHLLAAIDMSPPAARAISLGRDLTPNARTTLFHAYHVPYRRMANPSDAAATTLPFLHEAEDQYREWADTAQLTDLPKPQFIDGSPHAALDQIMASDPADLLDLGAHSRSNLGRYVLGGFTSGLIRNPPCDLLVCR